MNDLFSVNFVVFFIILVSLPVYTTTPIIQAVLMTLQPLSSSKFSLLLFKGTFLLTMPFMV